MDHERMPSLLCVLIIFIVINAFIRVIYGGITHVSSIQKSINPHWDKTKCDNCHKKDNKNSLIRLNTISGEFLCRECHEENIKHAYIHPIDLKINNARRNQLNSHWDDSLLLNEDGRIICQTCHDLLEQCLPDRSHKFDLNPDFLRGGPYPNRYTLCYRCHDSSKYERKNPHEQISKNGLLKMKSCRLCHDVDIKQEVTSGIEKNFDKYPLINGMNEDRTLLCVRCHRKFDHPSGALRVRSDKKYRHLVIMNNDKKEILKKQTLETGISLPLEPNTDRIYCGTCHQPHQPGVFIEESNSKDSLLNHRLRSKPICKHCHEIYGSLLNIGNDYNNAP